MCTDSLKSFGKTDNVAGPSIHNLMVGALMGQDWMDWTCGNFQYPDFLDWNNWNLTGIIRIDGGG